MGVSTQEYMRDNFFQQTNNSSSSSSGTSSSVNQEFIGADVSNSTGIDDSSQASPSTSQWATTSRCWRGYLHSVCMAAIRLPKSCCSCQPTAPSDLTYLSVPMSAEKYAAMYMGGFQLGSVSDEWHPSKVHQDLSQWNNNQRKWVTHTYMMDFVRDMYRKSFSPEYIFAISTFLLSHPLHWPDLMSPLQVGSA